MNGQDLFKSIQGADDRFIEEAEVYRKQKSTVKLWLRVAAIAAAVVVAAVAILLITNKQTEQGNSHGIKLQEMAFAVDENGNRTGITLDGTRWSGGDCFAGRDQGDFPDTATVEFDGKTYTGKYEYTIPEDYYNPNKTARYTYGKDNNETETIFFDIDQNGSLTSFNIVRDEEGVILIEKKGDKTVEDCRDEAFRIAGQFINTEDYEVTTKENDEIGVRDFYFKREVCGYETYANMSVHLNSCGQFYCFWRGNTNEFDNAVSQKTPEALSELLARLDSEETIAAIEERIKSYNPTMTDYEVVRKTVVVAPNGSLGMVF